MFDSIGWGEIIVLGLAALFIFGPERLPSLAKDAAQGLKRVREAVTGVRGESSVEGLELTDTRTGETRDLDVTGLFLAIGHDPRSQLFREQVRVDDAITEYLLDIVHATRDGDDLHVGVSTRGALTYYRAAQGLAFVSGRDYVVPDDVKTLAVPVLSHRVVGKSFLQAGEFGAAEAIIRDIVDRLRVPT